MSLNTQGFHWLESRFSVAVGPRKIEGGGASCLRVVDESISITSAMDHGKTRSSEWKCFIKAWPHLHASSNTGKRKRRCVIATVVIKTKTSGGGANGSARVATYSSVVTPLRPRLPTAPSLNFYPKALKQALILVGCDDCPDPTCCCLKLTETLSDSDAVPAYSGFKDLPRSHLGHCVLCGHR